MTYTCSHDSYILGPNLQSCRPIDRVRCVSGADKCNMPSMSPVPSESSSGFPLCGTFWQCIRYHVSVWVLGGGKGGFHGLDSAVHAKPRLQDGGSTHDKCRPLSIRPLRYIERRCRAVEHLGTPWAVALQLSTEVESIFTS